MHIALFCLKLRTHGVGHAKAVLYREDFHLLHDHPNTDDPTVLLLPWAAKGSCCWDANAPWWGCMACPCMGLWLYVRLQASCIKCVLDPIRIWCHGCLRILSARFAIDCLVHRLHARVRGCSAARLLHLRRDVTLCRTPEPLSHAYCLTQPASWRNI